MNADSLKKISELAPPVQVLARGLVSALAAQSIDIEITQGLRSKEMQDAVYAQGHAPLLMVNAKRVAVGLPPLTLEQNVRPVTNAPGGHSWHEFGCAFDVVPNFSPDPAHVKPDWNEADATWKIILTTGIRIGLTEGASWSEKHRDAPHFQLTGKFGVSPDDSVRAIYRNGGLPAVWNAAFPMEATT